MNNMTSRRGFFSKAMLSLATLIIAPRILAKECPKAAPEGVKVLEVDSAVGKRLQYVVDASTAKTNAKFVEGSNCENCQFYQVARAKDGYAPCTMGGMAFVTACGWCNLWKKNPKAA